jgi:hypothetical protein
MAKDEPLSVRRDPVKVWFWDGQREYTGEAVAVSGERMTAFLRMSESGHATVIPTPVIVQGLIKHLTNRIVEFKMTSGSLEADVKGRISSLNADFENPRRLLLEAEFQPSSERTAAVLLRLAKLLDRT